EVYDYINGNWYYLDSLGKNDTSYIHQSLLCNITHKYKIIGYENGSQNRTTESDTIWLTPYDSIAPDTVQLKYVTVLDHSTVKADWSASSADVGTYDIWVKSLNGSWANVKTVNRIDTSTFISGLNTKDSIYEISIVASDSCSNNKSGFGQKHTTSIIFATAQNKQVLLDWSNYKGFNSSNIYIEKYINGSWTTLVHVTNNLNYTDTGLGCNVVNYYRVKTIGTKGFISYSDSVEATPFDTVKPSPAKLKALSIVNQNSVSIDWIKSTDADVRNYEIWRSTNGGNAYKIDDVGDVSNYIDSTTSPKITQYCYYIVAYDSCSSLNRSIPSDTDCTNLINHTFNGCYPEITLHWTSYQTFENGILKHRIVKTDSIGNQFVYYVAGNIFDFQDTNVVEGSQYCYSIETIDSGMQDTAHSYNYCAVSFVYPKPIQANIKYTTIVASSSSLGQVKLAWSRNPNSDTLARGYRLYHSTVSSTTGFSLLYETYQLNDTSYIHDSANTANGRNYYYLEIFDYCNRTGVPSVVHSPINLQVTSGNLQAQLNWNRYEGWSVPSYDIYRNWNQNGTNYSWLMAQVDSGTFTLLDTNVSCDIHYEYIIAASNLFGTASTISNIDTGHVFDTIPPMAISVVSASVVTTDDAQGSIELAYNAAIEKNRSSYNIYRSIDAGSYSLISNVNSNISGVLIYTDNNINTKQSVHSYFVTALDSCGNESTPSDTHTVVNLTATALNDAVRIDWTPYKGFVTYDYLIERMDESQTSWIPVAMLPAGNSQFVDSTTTCNKTYYYRISTFNQLYNSVISYSDTQSVYTFEITAPNPVELTRVSVSHTSDWDGNIIVEWNESTSSDAALYVIDRRLKDDINWQQIGVVGRTNRFVDAGLNTQDTIYIYRIKVIDSCGNVSAYSTIEHGNVNLHTQAAEQSIFLNWGAYIGWPVKGYRLYRNGEYLADFADTIYQYLDTPLTCTQHMNYQLMAINVSDTNLVSYSDSSFNTAEDHTPPATSYLKYATVNIPNHQVKLEWNKAGGFDVAYYEIYRKYNGTKGWSKIHTTQTADTIYYDEVNHFDGSLCYRVVSSDSCSNFSNPSNDGCLVYLSGFTGDFRHTLNWTPYTQWAKKVTKYELWKTEDNQPTALIASMVADSLSWIDTLLTYNVKNFCYRVAAFEDTGSYDAVSWSNEVCMQQQPIYWIPNAFTPNDDDLNETFGPTGLFIDHYEMEIYNRWGQKVFTSTPSQLRWNGKFANGKAIAGEMYMYQIKFYSYDGRIYNVPGVVYILR
ncbi:MAG: gliding motility-associated C-terminal domain-containing protein, partial [Bacteroidetes bacterium]|nr:gliding motility-associated C-terminal domain-containing protein [Bacteroidota bacterium]